MKSFSKFLIEQYQEQDENNLSPEFQQAMEQAQAAMDQGDYEQAHQIATQIEPQSSEENSLLQAFMSALASHQGDMGSRFGADPSGQQPSVV